MLFKKFMIKYCNFIQWLLDWEYENNGLSDELLDLQVRLNELRADYDLPCSDEFLQ